MSSPVLKIENVSKYFSKRKILKNINLNIYSGEIIGLIGMSGHGKTTFLNTLIGFLRPDEGDVLFRLEHLLDYDDGADRFRSVYKCANEAKKIFGFAAQNPSFYPDLTVQENLDYFGSLYNLSKEIRKTNGKILLNLMGIYDYRKLKAKNLSGGMQKRLDIACALIHDPKVLILDEPTADLDPLLRKQMWQIINKINDKGTTIILASHFLNEVESFCDRVAIMKQGEVVDVGTSPELKEKINNDDKINLLTTPGNYSYLERHLQNKNMKVKDIYKEGKYLVIATEKAEIVLKKLLDVIEKSDENLVEVYVVKKSLGEVFEHCYLDDIEAKE